MRGQVDFARLLAENLKQPDFSAFCPAHHSGQWPDFLRQPTQYERLDNVVKSVIEGLPVEKLRIYDFSPSCCLFHKKRTKLAKLALHPPTWERAGRGHAAKSEIISRYPHWQAPFPCALDRAPLCVAGAAL